MKKNIDGEKIAFTIVILVVIVVVSLLIFVVFKSNFSLNNNTSDNNIVNNSIDKIAKPKEKVEPTKDDIDKMNVTPKEQKVPPKEETPPSVTTPIEEQISTYKTTIYDKEKGRIKNIGLAISKLNNTIVKKGQEFSFNKTIGAMGKEQGYEKALGFDTKGKKIQIYGGGMCQLSSTLYNTLLIAQLEVTERHPHSRRVYYVPKNKDATIFYPSLDLKFKNNSDGDIKIVGNNTDSDVTITLFKIK
ncbi:MAG: VanW family protein [Clostridia bacterium]